MKSFRTIICLFVCACASAINADAQAFHTLSRIQRLAAEIVIPPLSIDTCVTVSYKGYPVVIECRDTEISHMGIDIFGDTLRNSFNKQLYRFIEQYLLELLTCKTKSDQIRQMYDDCVIIMGNLNEIPLISSTDDICLSETFEQVRGYKIEWSNHKAIFSISFPPKYELISGLNKIELENRFVKLAGNHKIAGNGVSRINGDTIRISEDLFVVRNGFYILEQMACSRYFTYNKDYQRSLSQVGSTKDNACLIDTIQCICHEKHQSPFGYPDSLSLVCDVAYPVESLWNLLSVSSIQNDYIMEVKLNKYGFKQEVFYCPLSQIMDFCLQEGCKPYVGIEKREEDMISAVLIMVQPDYGYNHIFKIEFDTETLIDRKGTIRGIMNVYTPTHNIANLYGENNI